MASLKNWVQAARPRTLPLALSCALLGAVPAWQTGIFDGPLFTILCLTIVSLQVLSNLANDYGDHEKGTDNDSRLGPQRSLQQGDISPEQMWKAVIVSATFSLVSGVLLLYMSPMTSLWSLLAWLIVGLLAIWAAIRYTAGQGAYGYRMLGDLAVFLFFGLIGVLGSYLMFGSTSTPLPIWLLAIAMGSLSTAVLHLNNMRDRVNDEAMGKKTIAIALGINGSIIYQRALLLLAWSSLIGYLLLAPINSWSWVILAPMGLQVIHFFRVTKLEGRDIDPELKKIAISTFLIALVLFSSAALS